MTGEPYTSYAGPEGPAHFGLEPERIKLYNEQAKERIAAEKAAEKKAEEARLELGEFFFFFDLFESRVWTEDMAD